MAFGIGIPSAPGLGTTVDLEPPLDPLGRALGYAGYAGLKPNVGTTFIHEPNQALPIDGSDPLLRGLSQFSIRPTIPAVFSTNSYLNRAGEGRVYREVFEAGMSGRGLHRRALRQTPVFSPHYNAKSLSDYIHDGVITRSEIGDGSFPSTLHGQYSNRIGQATYAELDIARDIAAQLHSVQNTPPLIMLINPNAISIAYDKIQTYNDRSRLDFIHHISVEHQPKMSIKLKCGAFLSGGGPNGPHSGVQFSSRRDSAAWQNMMNLFAIYKHNGQIKNPDGSRAASFIGMVEIKWDGVTYLGNFESFSYTLDEAHQNGGIDFDLEFVCSAQWSDPPKNTVSPLKTFGQSLPSKLASHDEFKTEGGGTGTSLSFKPQSMSKTGSGGLGGFVTKQTAVPLLPSNSGFMTPDLANSEDLTAFSLPDTRFRRR